jgi:hypothetical protein
VAAQLFRLEKETLVFRTFVEAALIMVTCVALLKEVMWYVN